MSDWPIVVMLFGIFIIIVYISTYNKQPNNMYETKCINGVSYIQGPAGMTVEYQQDGTIKLCK